MKLRIIVGVLLIAAIMMGSIPTAMAVDDASGEGDTLRLDWIDGLPPQDGTCLDCTCTCDNPLCPCPCCA